ncbi:MAG TPA: polysaccharide deacetylase family protein [Candidatus Krumholzibacteria bacterium]|nr:polysaccharide deacetylase family protein [Candidatus Krumholzibacteria bacterium]
MNVLKFVFGHRGATNLIKRSAQIATRFGPTPGRMGGRFERFMDILDEFSIRPTFPITALPMSRNPAFAHRLVDRGAELAVHAWSHIDLSALDLAGQREHMSRAVELFRSCSVPFTGFRAPYLHWNEDTMRVVGEFQFRYSSNLTLWWDVLDEASLGPKEKEGMARGKAFYRPIPAAGFRALPFRRDGFIEIPVCLPDDEIPLDRMYVHDADYLGTMWRGIFAGTYARGELFTLQLHPERIDFFADALRGLLADARTREPAVWIATLDEIAQWWEAKARNRAQFVRERDSFRVNTDACPGTVLFLRQNGAERRLEAGTLQVDSAYRPCVGVAPGSNRAAIAVLADLGYIVETGDRSDGYAVHLGLLEKQDYGAIQACRRVIDESSRPLLCFGTWPRGCRSALSVTGDIDALTIWDFVQRFRGQ